MAAMGVLKDDSEKSGSSCHCPIPVAAVETAAIIASKTSTAPMPSAPSLANFPKPRTPTASGTCSRYGLSRPHPEKQQHAKQPHQLQQITSSTTKTKQNNTNNNHGGDDNATDVILRSGKWAAEEELYANILIELFEEGRVDEFERDNEGNHNDVGDETNRPKKVKITNGMTLRAYLSRKLCCSPMRISKKFAGRGIGKLVYMSQSPGTYQRHKQRFPFCAGQITNNRGLASSPASTMYWNKLNRLKEAESNFFRIAFPQRIQMKAEKQSRSAPTIVASPSAAFSSPSKRSLPIEGSRPDKVPRIGASSGGPLVMKAPLSIDDKTSPNNQPNLGAYQSQLLHHQHHGQYSATLGDSAPTATSSQNARNNSYAPLAPFPKNALQLQQGQNANSQIMGSQHHPKATGVMYSGYRATAFPGYDKTKTAGPSAIVSSPNSLSQKQPSPLMAAPKLLSPTLKQKNNQRESLMPKPLPGGSNHRTEFGSTSQPQRMQPEQTRLTVQQKNQSQIQTLKDAYFSSISPHKSQVPKNAVIDASSKAPAPLMGNNALRHESELYHKRLDHSSTPMESQTNSVKNIAADAQLSTKIESGPSLDWSRMVGDPSKSDINVPNYLSGFEKESKGKMGTCSPFGQNDSAVAGFDLQQLAENSPAYHRSKSFDDFHQYLGKGLSPAIPPPPKFPSLRTTTAGPAIPSIHTSDEASMSNLQMRPRKIQNLPSAGKGKGTASSKSFAPIIEDMSDENFLSEAYAEAVRSTESQQELQTPQALEKNSITTSDQYNHFGSNPAIPTSKNPTCAPGEMNRERPCQSGQTQQSDYPIEGMLFEDFGTLASYDDTTIKISASFMDRCAMVSDPSDEDPNSGAGGGGGISDDSDSSGWKNLPKAKGRH